MERIDIIKQFLEDTPDDSFLHHCLALENIKLGNKEEARTIFRQLLERDPGHVGSYYHYGQLLEVMSFLDQAEDAYLRGIEAAKASGDRRALSELRAAYEYLTTP